MKTIPFRIVGCVPSTHVVDIYVRGEHIKSIRGQEGDPMNVSIEIDDDVGANDIFFNTRNPSGLGRLSFIYGTSGNLLHHDYELVIPCFGTSHDGLFPSDMRASLDPRGISEPMPKSASAEFTKMRSEK